MRYKEKIFWHNTTHTSKIGKAVGLKNILDKKSQMTWKAEKESLNIIEFFTKYLCFYMKQFS